MKKPIVILLLFIFCFMAKSGIAQRAGYPDSIRILPDNPQSGDTIRIALHTYLNTSEPIAWVDHQVNPGEIDIQGCFPVSVFGVGSYFSDTLIIGSLPAGNYLLHYTYYTSLSKDSCVRIDSADTSFTFKVSPPTVIRLPNRDNAIEIYPNPTTETLLIRTDKRIAIRWVSIRDMQGRLVREYAHLESGSLDVSELPQGMYLLYLDTDKGRVLRRFQKDASDL